MAGRRHIRVWARGRMRRLGDAKLVNGTKVHDFRKKLD